MSQQRWKKRTGGVKAPPEFESFCTAIFLALAYEVDTPEEAMVCAVKEASREELSAVKRYLRDVEENEHDATDLSRAWEKAADTFGYAVKGDARGLTLLVSKILKQIPKPDRRVRRHG